MKPKNDHSIARKTAREKSKKKRKKNKSRAIQEAEPESPANLTGVTDKSGEVLQGATTQWIHGDWQSLAAIDPSSPQPSQARGKVALFAAAGHLQCGNTTTAEMLIAFARKWGADNQQIGRILISGAYNSLARAMALAGNPDKGLDLFERSFAVGLPDCEPRPLAETRSKNQWDQLGLILGTSGPPKSRRVIPRDLPFRQQGASGQGAMRAVQIDLTSWALPSDCGIIRQPTRAPDLRHGDFWERYDATTVIFDLFRTQDPEMLLAICPPLHNLEQDLALRFRAEPSGKPCSFTRQTRVNGDRLWIRVPKGTERLVAETSIGEIPLIPGPDMTDVFRDLRVAFTLSKDNDLVWIRDWAAYNARVHGVDAVVVYDNGSTRYGRADIESALATVPELALFSVIDWPFRYGPADYRRDLTVGMADCDYCQVGALEHAARRMFSQAAAVINTDIDELIYAVDDIDLFDALRDSETGYLSIHGHWVEAVPDVLAPTRRHAAYSQCVRQETPAVQSTKWVVDPRRLHPDAFWNIHLVYGADCDRGSVNFRFGHYRAISTNWDLHDYKTDGTLRTEARPDNELQELPMLRAALDIAFPDREEGFVETPVSLAEADTFVRAIHQSSLPIDDGQTENHSAQYWHQRSVIIAVDNYLEPGQPELNEALDLVRRAVEVAPSNLYCLEALVFRSFQAGRGDVARGSLDMARPGSSPWERAHFNALRAYVLFKLEEFREAAAAIATAMEDFDAPGYCFLKAQISDRLDLHQEAEEAYRGAIRLMSDKGCMALMIDDIARRRYAVGHIRQYADINLEFPAASDILVAFVRFLLRAGRAPEAEIVARKLMASEPLNLRSHVLLASCMQAQGNADGLRQTRENCLATYHQLCRIRNHEGQTPAKRIRQRILLKSDVASVLLKSGEFGTAMGYIEQIISEPVFVDYALYPVIAELLKLQRVKEAHRLAGTITDRRPDSQQALDFLMRTSKALKDVDTVRWVAGRLAELRPHKGAPMAILGNLLIEAGHVAEGLEALRDAVKREPDNLCHHRGLFWALVSASERKESEARLLEIVYRFPGDPSVHLLMANCMRWHERPELARLAAHRLLAMQPDHAGARKILNDLGDPAVPPIPDANEPTP